MEPRDFCYWLQGFFEISKAVKLTEDQTQMVKNHLSLVFAHSIDTPDPTGKLQNIHDGVDVGGGPMAPSPKKNVYRC